MNWSEAMSAVDTRATSAVLRSTSSSHFHHENVNMTKENDPPIEVGCVAHRHHDRRLGDS